MHTERRLVCGFQGYVTHRRRVIAIRSIHMRKNLILAFAFLVAGAILGAGALSIYRAASSTPPMSIDPALLAQWGDPSLSGVAIHCKTTQGGRIAIQYKAPPMSKGRSPYANVRLTADNVIEIDDELHDVILDFNQGTIVLNGSKYVSCFPERSGSLISTDQPCNIDILGDGRIVVNGINYVKESSSASDRGY